MNLDEIWTFLGLFWAQIGFQQVATHTEVYYVLFKSFETSFIKIAMVEVHFPKTLILGTYNPTMAKSGAPTA